MRKSSRKSKWIAFLAVAVLLIAQLGIGVQAATPVATAQAGIGHTSDFAEDAAYLRAYFSVDTPTSWTAASFSAALEKVAGEEAHPVDGQLTALSAVRAAVASAAYDELAKSYPADKAKARLKAHKIDDVADSAAAAYLACGLDTGLFDRNIAVRAASGKSLTKEQGARLLMAVADANGNARNFLGYSNDPQIHAKLDNAWNSFLLFDQPALTAIGKTSVEKGITTGYNLKNNLFSARFLPNLTMQYGHSDIKHAHQLLGLLSSEDIVVKVQLEPKISVFQHLLEWGPAPTEATPTYEVRKYSDDLYLVFAVEYDLQLEFASKADLMAFDEVILNYAKKNEGNEKAVGLIYGSWWQPLYTTTRKDMPTGSYYQIYDCVIRKDNYSIHPFCLAENLDSTVAKLNAVNPSYKVKPVVRYCNKAFHNYMTGEDYQ